MKIAVSGKGGTGKSTVAAVLALLLAKRGKTVLAVDADPDANLASALGVPATIQHGIRTIAHDRVLIEERTGARAGEPGQIFRLNPEVADIADRFACRHRGVSLVVLGAIDGGGSGCACPDSTLLRALVSEIVLRRNEALVMDMEAGVEHLGRATAQGVDALLVMAEPGQRSVESARRIAAMAGEIGIGRILVIANKVRSEDDLTFLQRELERLPFLGFLPFTASLLDTDRDGMSALDGPDEGLRRRFEDLLDTLERRILGDTKLKENP